MPTRNVNLTEALDAFVEQAVASGRYGNASEVVRDALRRLDRALGAEAARPEGLCEAGEGLAGATDGIDACMDRLVAEAMAAALGEAWDEGLASGAMRDGAQALARLRTRLGAPRA